MVRLNAKTTVTHSEDGSHSTQLALAVPISDVKLKATIKDNTLTKEPRYKKGLVLGVEKPGDFCVDYNVEDRVSCTSQRACQCSSPCFQIVVEHLSSVVAFEKQHIG